MATQPKKTGRPRKHPDRRKAAFDIFGRMAQGLSMRKACLEANISPGTLLLWVDEENLSEQYAEAREALLEFWADEIMDISDTPVGTLANGGSDSGAVQDKRLRVDTRKWLLSKLGPKKYGDRTIHAGDESAPIAVTEVKRVIIDS